MDVTDVEKTTGIGRRREALLANMELAPKSNFESAGGPRPAEARALRK
jgi:hypothetical protein